MILNIPNQLTILRIILTPVFCFLMLQQQPELRLWGTIVFFIASATDWYDGYIARKKQMITRWGQFMDPLADKILNSSAFIIFAALGLFHWWMVWVIVIRDVAITALRIFALYVGKSIVTSLVAKWKTFLQMTMLFVVLIYINIPASEFSGSYNPPLPLDHWISISMLAITLLTAWSGIQYLIVNRMHLLELSKRFLKLFSR